MHVRRLDTYATEKCLRQLKSIASDSKVSKLTDHRHGVRPRYRKGHHLSELLHCSDVLVFTAHRNPHYNFVFGDYVFVQEIYNFEVFGASAG